MKKDPCGVVFFYPECLSPYHSEGSEGTEGGRKDQSHRDLYRHGEARNLQVSLYWKGDDLGRKGMQP